MDFNNIYTELKKSGTDDVMKNYVKKGAKGDVLGVSIDKLHKLKATIVSPEGKKGVNHSIAKELWETRNLEARMLACMVADPAKISRSEANKWMLVINFYSLADLFADLIAQTPFGIDVMYHWIQSQQEYVKRVGFSILKYFADNDKKRSNIFFSAFVQKIKQEIQTSENRAKEAMYQCMIAMGSRNEYLRDMILDASRGMAPVIIEEEDGKIESFVIDEIVADIWQKQSK